MARATELTQVSPDCAIWHAYDSVVRAELFSTALRTKSGVVLIDPIPLADEPRQQLGQFGTLAAVLLTNANHARAAAEFTNGDAMFVPAELLDDFPGGHTLTDGTCVHGLNAIAIGGGAPGEFVLHDARDGGTLIMGDAIINFGQHGFSLLPAKYCANRKQMICSLRRLLDLSFTRLFFAHGDPVLTRARERLAALLDEGS